MELATKKKGSTPATGLLELIRSSSQKEIRIIQACGAMAAYTLESGIHEILPPNISLVSGPGHSACAPPVEDIDKAIGICQNNNAIVTAFEDMLQVPGSSSSLQMEMARGTDVRSVDSSFKALQIAAENKDKKVVFVGAGFEATASTVAATILEARRRGIKNFFVLSLHRLLSPALDALLSNDDTEIDALMCPAHISGVIGSNAYIPLAEKRGVPFVVAGFEPLDILQSIHMLVEQTEKGHARVQTQYKRGVTSWGNRNALSTMERVFRASDCRWRGMGAIPKSGLTLRLEFNSFNAKGAFDLSIPHAEEHPQCVCGDILWGRAEPFQCSLFGGECAPGHPVGPSMASSTGMCLAYHRHNANKPGEAATHAA